MLDPKKNSVHEVRCKRVLVRIKCCPKINVKKSKGSKNFGSRIILGSKKFWVQRNFGYKNFRKEYQSLKNFSQNLFLKPTLKVWSKLSQ